MKMIFLSDNVVNYYNSYSGDDNSPMTDRQREYVMLVEWSNIADIHDVQIPYFFGSVTFQNRSVRFSISGFTKRAMNVWLSWH